MKTNQAIRQELRSAAIGDVSAFGDQVVQIIDDCDELLDTIATMRQRALSQILSPLYEFRNAARLSAMPDDYRIDGAIAAAEAIVMTSPVQPDEIAAAAAEMAAKARV